VCYGMVGPKAIACSGMNCHTGGMYSPEVLEHFKNPRHTGTLENGGTVVEVTNPVCGDTLSLSARMEAGRVIEARFLAKGCVTSIACGSVLADRMHGETPGELAKITPEQISEALGGLPSATFHGAQLACDALAALLDKLPARAISA
jgi:nitrogen fixation NifU-like protein